MYKDGKWARAILAQQREDGSFGFFHTLSKSSNSPITTEQALRRLLALGFTAEDAPVRKTLDYLESCLAGERTIPDRRERGHSWELFVSMMLSVWIRFLTPHNGRANAVARQWGGVITSAFSSGSYVDADYRHAYGDIFGRKPEGGRLEDFVTFYQVALLAGEVDAQTEHRLLDYVLRHTSGIYYLYGKPLITPPAFQSRETSSYLAAIELLSRYPYSAEQLAFAAAWLEQHRDADDGWDMGAAAKDGVYFPRSDSWRTRELRRHDCTERITQLLKRLHAAGPD